MAGNPKENEIAGAVHDRIDAAWPIIAKRVRAIPEYADMFADGIYEINDPRKTSPSCKSAMPSALSSIPSGQSHDSPFDTYLTKQTLLPEPTQRGMDLFYGKANCASCHSGPLFTDQKFHALGLPAFGPGRTRRFDPMPRDVGRMGESDALKDAYRFQHAPA